MRLRDKQGSKAGYSFARTLGYKQTLSCERRRVEEEEGSRNYLHVAGEQLVCLLLLLLLLLALDIVAV